MGTPHNEAEKGEIAKRVLMPGDPSFVQNILRNIFWKMQYVLIL